MIYIFTTLYILCVIFLFIETELGKCSVTYKNRELKIIKYKNSKYIDCKKIVYKKVYKGWIARLIYKIFCG